MADPAAVDTSPLLYLARADLLHLSQIAGPRIVVPSAVADEVRAWPTADAAVRALDSQSWLQLISPQPIPPIILAWDLA